MTISKVYKGLWFTAVLLFVVWIFTQAQVVFAASMLIFIVSYIIFTVDDNKKRRRWIKEVQATADANLLAIEAQLYLAQYEAARHGMFVCVKCGSISNNINDVREGYCGRCHAFTGPKFPDAPEFDV